MNTFSHFASPQLANKWDALDAKHPLERMCFLLKPQSTDVVCDVGTGKGSAAKAVAEVAQRVVTLDIEDQSRHLKGDGFEKVEFCRTDLSNGLLPFEEASFDIVICRATLHHIENKQQFFREATRVLRPEGRVYIMDPIMSPELRLAWSIVSRIAERDYRSYVTENELIGSIADAGLCAQYQGSFLFPRSLQQWLDEKINPMNAAGSDAPSKIVAHVRHCIRDVIFDLLPDNLQNELHLQKDTPEGWFAYNCVELVATKKGAS